MRPDFIRLLVLWCVVAAVISAIPLLITGSPPAAAWSAEDYFQISYEPVSYSKTEIHGDEVFYATIEGSATCTNDLPIPVSALRITARVIAEHNESGNKVTLNSSYTTTIEPFPDSAGETIEISRVIPLKFPPYSESGEYSITGEIEGAQVKALFMWIDVPGDISQDQPMGSLSYIAEGEPSTPGVTPTVTPTAKADLSTAAGLSMVIWVGIGIAIIIFIASFVAIWLIKRRKK
jgi:hypothetical protein